MDDRITLEKKSEYAAENEPMVSVALVTYKHEAYIREALDSILAQQVDFSYEIVVGDDCSPDGTQDILREYAARYPGRFVLLLREKNLGATANSYDIKCHCQGRYIAQLEGDDFWTDPLKLRKQVDFLESHPEYIGTAHMHNVVDEHSRPIEGIDGYCEPGRFTMKDYLVEGNLPGQTATLVYRNIYRNPLHDYSIEAKAHDFRSDVTVTLILLSLGDIYTFTESMSSRRLVRKVGETNWNSVSMTRDLKVDECLLSARLLCWRRREFGPTEAGNARMRMWQENALIVFLKRPGRKRLMALKEVVRETSGPGFFVFRCLGLIPGIIKRKLKGSA